MPVATPTKDDQEVAPPHLSANAQLAAALILVLVLNLLSLLLAKELGFGRVDDAYISYRYAENLAQGHGLVFNPGQRVEGFSNPLWTLQLAAVAKIGGKLPDWSVILGMLAHLLYALLVSRTVALRLCPGFGATGALAVGALMALSTPLLFYGVSGLETAQHTALVTAALMMTALSRSGFGLSLGVACTALASVSRPEGIGLVPVVAVVLALRADLSPRRRMTILIILAVATAAVFGAYVGWRHRYYGEWLPNTFYAKVDVPSLSLLIRGAGAVVEFALGSLLLLWAPLWLWLCQERSRSWTAAVVLGFGLFAMFAWVVGGDWMPLGRFLVPVSPVLAAALVQVLCALATRLSTHPRRFLLIASVLVGTASGLAFYGGEFRTRLPQSPLAEYKAIGQWLARQAGPGESMAGTAMGVIPYVSKLEAHDFLGLTDPEVAKHGMLYAHAPPGHRRQGAEHILSLRPSYLIIWSKTFPYPITEDSFITKRANFPAFVKLLNIPAFTIEYRYAVVRVTLPQSTLPAYLALYVKRTCRPIDEVQPITMRNVIWHSR